METLLAVETNRTVMSRAHRVLDTSPADKHLLSAYMLACTWVRTYV